MNLDFRRIAAHLHGGGMEVEIHVRHLLDLQERSNRLLAEYTGQPYEQIVNDFQRDRYFTASEALEYGIVDKLVEIQTLQSNRHLKAVPPDIRKR